MLSCLNVLPSTISEDMKDLVKENFERLMPPLLNFIRKGGVKELSPTSDANLVKSCMNLMDTLMDEFHDEEKFKTLNEREVASWLECIFLFSCVWSLGASVDNDGRNKFNELFRELLDGPLSLDTKQKFHILDMVQGPSRPYLCPFPSKGLVYDYRFIKEGMGKWELWIEEIKDAPPIGKDMQFSEIIIPTIDTVRYTYLVKQLVEHQKQILIVGPTGTGKSVYINVSTDIYSFSCYINFDMVLILC